MAEALETKKRRLYKLLDNLSSSDVHSTKSPSTSTTSSAKRSLTVTERFEEARERASKRLRHSTSTGSLSSLPSVVKVAPSRTVAKRNGDDKAPPPNFSPWSHDMFLQRLKSFSSVSLWHPKPEGISEVEWAKRGWRCVNVNTVACKGGCEKRVIVSLDAPVRKMGPEDEGEGEGEDEDDAQEEFERVLVERYKDIVADGHAGHCMWRASGCRDDIYRVQVVRPSVWQPELRKRCTSVLKISSSIDRVTLRPLEADGIKSQPANRLVKDLPADLTASDALSPTSDPDVNSKRTTNALSIALHGWRGAREAGFDLLHCDACFQRIGLWMYEPDYKKRSRPTLPEDDEDDNEDSTMAIDLTELHRDHCPWRNSSSQHSSGSLAGLNASQILQRVVATYARDLRRRSAEQGQQVDVLESTVNEIDDDEEAGNPGFTPVKASREEVAKADKERESRLRRLKSMFSVRRKKSGAAKSS